jgi:2-C-methyl-D-erythritol 4-phosphate cytidylyltransferase/2-C-methyl-D-erythritol 2,4-cyclodiphosphate synthase
VTVIAQKPKLAPYKKAMQARLAEVMGLPADRISVKATTTEKLGFTGRGEGIASTAAATLVK